jgi:hypothetical protein
MFYQLVQMATSVYYNQDLTKKREKDRRHHDLVPDREQISGFATIVDRRNNSNGSVHEGGSPGDSPGPLWDPALSVSVTTGSHTVPISSQRRRQMAPLNDGSQGLLSRLQFLTSRLRSPG